VIRCCQKTAITAAILFIAVVNFQFVRLNLKNKFIVSNVNLRIIAIELNYAASKESLRNPTTILCQKVLMIIIFFLAMAGT